MAKGWISIHRKIEENWVWEDKPFSYGQAWIDLILLANHEDTKEIKDGKLQTFKMGTVNRSILWLSERWGWDRKKTKKFLKLLESDEMVSINSTTHGTTIALVNYEVYRYKGTTDGTTTTPTPTPTEGQPLPINNNDNNENNENKNNKYMCAFDEFWRNYPRKKDKSRAYKCYQARLKDGYTEDQLLTACINYAAECMKNRTEERYIKHGATFLSVNEPFLDYLKGDNSGRPETDDGSEERRIAELKEYLKSDEFKAGDNLPFM